MLLFVSCNYAVPKDVVMQHDVQFDYYGKRVATASSDRSVRIFNVVGQQQELVQTLVGYVSRSSVHGEYPCVDAPLVLLYPDMKVLFGKWRGVIPSMVVCSLPVPTTDALSSGT
jgi:hypothetical protein